MAGSMSASPSVSRLRQFAALAAVVSLVPAATPTRAEQRPSGTGPALVVLVVVDQMRADYAQRYGRHWTQGLKRLFDRGTVYDDASYPYLNTVTCAGHATLSTGAFPKTHGIIMNQWFDRDTAAIRTCTADRTVATYTYGREGESAGHSAAALRVPTLAERLRAQWPDSRAVTVSLKPRSAIMMAGKGATAVTWYEGGWQSSTAFGRPHAEMAPIVARHPLEALRSAVWTRLLRPSAYQGVDDGLGERPEKGRDTQFPHPLTERGADPAKLWEESPFSDDALGDIATSAIRRFKLGQRGAVDFLGVSFSSTDFVGHAFGPESHELQDTLARLDRTIGRLLHTLDREVGRTRYVLALSADHGVVTVPEVARAAGQSAGRVPSAKVRATVEQALAGLVDGPVVARAEYTQLYVTPAARAKLTATTVAPALAALRAMPGIAAAVWAGALDEAPPGVAPELLAAIRAGHVPDRSGDIVIVPAPNWIFVLGTSDTDGDATTHGSPYPYDQHVPLVFLGGPFTPGHRTERVTPADIAPTLAAIAGIPYTGTEGRALVPAR